VYSPSFFQLENKQRHIVDLERRLMDTELRFEQERQQWLLERSRLNSSRSPSQHNIEVTTDEKSPSVNTRRHPAHSETPRNPVNSR
jgi:hypothetical protein